MRRRLTIILGGCCAILSGCHLVPSQDVRAFMTDLEPRPGPELDEAVLADEIRMRTAVESFEFDERFDSGEPPIPPLFSHFIQLVAGN